MQADHDNRASASAAAAGRSPARRARGPTDREPASTTRRHEGTPGLRRRFDAVGREPQGSVDVTGGR